MSRGSAQQMWLAYYEKLSMNSVSIVARLAIIWGLWTSLKSILGIGKGYK